MTLNYPTGYFVESWFEQVGAIKRGHFILSWGRHSEIEIDKEPILSNPHYLWLLATHLALRIRNVDFQVICAPTFGGAMLASAVGMALDVNLGRKVSIAYMEEIEEEGKRVRIFRNLSQADLLAKKVLLIDDTLTTGKTLLKCADAVQDVAGIVVGTGVLWNRSTSEWRSKFRPLHNLISLIDREIPTWAPEECMQSGPCSRQVPFTGKRAEEGRRFALQARMQTVQKGKRTKTELPANERKSRLAVDGISAQAKARPKAGRPREGRKHTGHKPSATKPGARRATGT